jgi:hypothetical protein
MEQSSFAAEILVSAQGWRTWSIAVHTFCLPLQYFVLPSFTGVAPPLLPATLFNPLSRTLWNLLSTDYPELRMEYDAML